MSLYIMNALLLLVSMWSLLIAAYNGDASTGVILYANDTNVRSGVLSADHRCQVFPTQFPTHEITNPGTSHCLLWTEDNCQGKLFIVPARYAIEPPKGFTFRSVICS
ncbi:hypothetical protein BC940DRAFT_294734 [Gongronella butleri]|nr:hypothetical protein BC940DRAFT_294734 [Gongronella butleri]